MHIFVCSRRPSPDVSNGVQLRFDGDLSWARGSLAKRGVSDNAKASEDVTMSPVAAETGESELPLKEACEQFERQYVVRVLHRVQWNISRAARVLRVHRNTILRKLSAWGLERPDGEADEARVCALRGLRVGAWPTRALASHHSDVWNSRPHQRRQSNESFLA